MPLPRTPSLLADPVPDAPAPVAVPVPEPAVPEVAVALTVGAPVPVVDKILNASDSARMPAVLSTEMNLMMTPLAAGSVPVTTYWFELVETRTD